jgi:hypothetical protein
LLSPSWMVALCWLVFAESGPLSNSFLKASLMTAIPNEALRSAIELRESFTELGNKMPSRLFR